ncbi:MAG: glycosyltransferase family 2 protein [Candidatus Rokubacteria bacterium]|nr:glycosyltransferase family 2 protein [Candidatus Rokubacteria bacterium]
MVAPSIAIVIPAHNNRRIIDACLESIRRQTYGDWECLVVDDASEDGTADEIRRRHAWVKVLESGTNLGPAHCRNIAVSRSSSEFIAFLDSDVVLDPRWLEHTVGVLRANRDVAMVGGKLLYVSNKAKVNSFGGAMSRIGLAWNQHEGGTDVLPCKPVESLFVCSAAAMVRRDSFEMAGGFDETFFYGYEDSDLGWSLNLLGFRAVSIPEAVAYHSVSETISRMGERIVFHSCKNRLRSMLKHYGTACLARYLPIYLLYSLIDAAARPPRLAKLRAIAWNIHALRDTLRRRRKTQVGRKLRDSEVGRLFSARLFPPVRLGKRRGMVAGRS